MEKQRKRRLSFWMVYLAIVAAVSIAFQYVSSKKEKPTTVTYSELVTHVREGHVAKAEIRPDEIVLRLQPEHGERLLRAERLPGIDESPLIERMREQGVELTGFVAENPWWQQLVVWVLPPLLILGFYLFAMRRFARQSGPLTIGKSQAKIYDKSREEHVTFEDVAGVDEAKAELAEVVDLLKNPGKYQSLGAKIPKGVLLVGPPGTGKTLLARAVAGEADVPFFSLSGSDFVQMFVGVGAARVRDLFEQASSRAPCIIFIDELDAIGRARGGVRAMATHDEREQTLNQLLVEMDGFDATRGVIILAATNQPEVLDPALLRAGRFDRRVVVDRPDLPGREAVLRVHTRKVKLADDVDLQLIARRTPGMVGADLANLVNEAALAAARRGASAVGKQDFEEAVDRAQLGLKKQGRAMNEVEKRRVAYHESGHALVAMSVDNADPVHRVTIVPRTIGALGATLQLPTEERYLMTRAELHDRLAVMLGGRVAEELTCDDISTGAQNDLERASETARQMVTRFGMSEELGPLTYGAPPSVRFLEIASGHEERNFSEHTAQLIDNEVRSIIERAHQRAQAILKERRKALDAMVEALLDRETLDQDDLQRIVGNVPVALQASRG